MFSSIWRFLKRHKRKFVAGSIIISSVIFLTRYTQRKLREWQDNEIRMLMEKTKKRQYYESIEKTCNQMILSLAANLRNSVIKENDTETIINQLRDGTANKIASWNQLKILAFTRSAIIIYSYTMLVTLLRIQVTLISGHMYKNAQNVNNGIIGNEVQAKYMALSSYFIYESVKNLNNLIKSKVVEVTASLSLTEQLTLRDLEHIYWALASSISADSSKDPVKNFTYYILQKNTENNDTSIYTKLIDQMLDVSESEEVQDLMQKNVRSGFVLLMDHVSVYFNNSKINNGQDVQDKTSHSKESNIKNSTSTYLQEATNNGSSEFVNINKTTMALAKIIPIINGLVPDNPTSKDISADWLQYLISNNELKILGANVYEAFSCLQN
ncbi:peroxisomal biogenesis factor 3 [Cataglyphis hispanica]|uniref:peroxisomal biogenesis factor 3 n=1 Tax=Cataglyphis hispanica TaxID=1086592 RepID=UPI00217FE166|nr:peroxisomal biogenesis factor 3 [Cataglyphis hispanica]